MTDSNPQITTQPPKIRHDWYQTETHVILNILAKKVKQEDVKANYENDSVHISFPLENGDNYNLDLKLAYGINPAECSFKVLQSKVEVKLKKLEGYMWAKLEEDPSINKKAKPIPTGGSSQVVGVEETPGLKYPSSSRKAKDWDKVATAVEDENPEGDAALNALFQKIYSEGSDEVRKAMNKSFVESGGTVLSTNWGEVGKEKVDVKPPDGMEWKKWDS